MLISFRIFHSLLWSHIQNFRVVNEAKVDAFLELLYIFDDPADVGGLISGSSDFSKSNLNIWNFTLHLLLKTFLENFEHYFAGMWDKSSSAVVEHSLALPFLVIRMKGFVQSCGHCWVIKICYYIGCRIFTESSFRIWNSSTGIPSPPWALFIVMIPKVHLT